MNRTDVAGGYSTTAGPVTVPAVSRHCCWASRDRPLSEDRVLLRLRSAAFFVEPLDHRQSVEHHRRHGLLVGLLETFVASQVAVQLVPVCRSACGAHDVAVPSRRFPVRWPHLLRPCNGFCCWHAEFFNHVVQVVEIARLASYGPGDDFHAC